jgi:hypothetical protein
MTNDMKDQSKSSSCPKAGHNIVFTPLPELYWGTSQAQDSAQRLADYASYEAQIAIDWYLNKKKSKKDWAQRLRVLAILATAVAGLIPVLAQISPNQIAPAWASVALVVAATAVGLDRFFGFSSAWIRFLTTEMQIRNALHQFLLDWELQRIKLEGEIPDLDRIQAMAQRCKDFICQINEILKDEMDDWVQEFRRNLAEIDKAAKARAQATSFSAVNVKVSNGDQCEHGWELSIDDGAPSRHRGKTVAVPSLLTGQHTVRVIGTIAGKELRAEAAFNTTGGRTEMVSLTLD